MFYLIKFPIIDYNVHATILKLSSKTKQEYFCLQRNKILIKINYFVSASQHWKLKGIHHIGVYS